MDLPPGGTKVLRQPQVQLEGKGLVSKERFLNFATEF